jgi:methionyl-tRNA synthetase
MKSTYITTTIPYVNAAPHIGHALELVQADAFARYCRLVGEPVHLQSGTDDNAFKNVTAARSHGVAVEEWVNRHAEQFASLVRRLNVSVDSFVRTSDEVHARAVSRFWSAIEAGHIYRNSYQGLYCQGCEDFVTQRDLVDGKCPDHGTSPETVCEENYFFRLSGFREELENLILTGRIDIVPAERRREVLAFIGRGLSDFSVSRPSIRSGGWGVAVPGDPTQTVYVWIDALINYITGSGYGSKVSPLPLWNSDTRKVHVIGKNVWKFHAVYWPALLLAAGLPLPDRIVVHGFVTEDGRKISKSSGRSVDPLAFVAGWGADALRYYLLRYVPPFSDGDFSAKRFERCYETDLANGLGNLATRVTTLCGRTGLATDPLAGPPDAPDGYHASCRSFRFGDALEGLWRTVDEVNRDIDLAKPWESLKSNRPWAIHPDLRRWISALRSVAWWAQPFLPNKARELLAGISGEAVKRVPSLFPRVR